MRFALTAAVTAISVSLVGCSTAGLTAPTPIFPAPDKQIDTSGFPANALNCDAPTKAPLLTDSKNIPTEFVQFGVLGYCYYSETDPATPKANQLQEKFVAKGITLADQTCDQFFNRMEAQRQGVEYSQANTNTAGTGIIAALSFSGNHVRSVFNTATLLSASNGFYENYKSNFILTPQLQKLREKVQVNLKDPIAEQMRQKSRDHLYTSYDDAKQDLLRYERLCSHTVLQDIVTDMVTKTELIPYAGSVNGVATNPAAAKIAAELYAIGSSDGAGQYSQGEIEVLYVIATIQDETARKTAVQAAMKLYSKLLAHFSKLDLETGSNDSINGVRLKLYQLGAMLGLEGKSTVSDYRLKIAAQVADDKAGSPAPAADGKVTKEGEAYSRAQRQRKDSFEASVEGQSEAVAAKAGSKQISFGYKVLGSNRN